MCPCGSWGENVGSWTATRRCDPNFLLLRYEDMLADVSAGAARISNFLGLPCDSKCIAIAVGRSSLENMRRVEKAEGKKWESTKEHVRICRSFVGQSGRRPKDIVPRIHRAHRTGLGSAHAVVRVPGPMSAIGMLATVETNYTLCTFTLQQTLNFSVDFISNCANRVERLALGIR